jgi:hypothetical protein
VHELEFELVHVLVFVLVSVCVMVIEIVVVVVLDGLGVGNARRVRFRGIRKQCNLSLPTRRDPSLRLSEMLLAALLNWDAKSRSCCAIPWVKPLRLSMS